MTGTDRSGPGKREVESVDRVLVAGATGKTGSHVLDGLQERGYEPKVITRSSDRANWFQSEGIDAVAGNLFAREDAARAVKGVDAVITTVGSTPGQVIRAQIPGVAGPDRFVDGQGNVNLVRAAEDAGVEAFVMCSSLGVDGDRGSWMSWFFRVYLGPVLEAKGRAERAIRESSMRGTIFRPGVLFDWLSPLAVGDLRVGRAGVGVWGAVPRRDLAELLVAALSTPAAAGETFEVARNPWLSDRDAGIDWDR